MKVRATYVKYYDIDVEVSDDATPDEIYDAVKDEIELLEETNLLEESETADIIKEIVDENDNYICEE